MSRYPNDDQTYKRAARSGVHVRRPDDPPFASLDPGIRELVRLLWIAGFNPTDSGDGVSKLQEEGCTLDLPHVFMVPLDASQVFAEANRLHAFVVDVLNLWIDPVGTQLEQGARTISLEASYDPATGTAVLALIGIDDGMLPTSVRTAQP